MDTDAVRRLRDRLAHAGRPSLVPPDPSGLPPLTPYEQASLGRIEPLAELLFLGMASDGHVATVEVDALRGAVRTLTDGLLRGATADALVARFGQHLEAEGYEARLIDVTQRLAADRDDAELALLLFAAVVLADGDVAETERKAFDDLAMELGVSPKRVKELLGPTAPV